MILDLPRFLAERRATWDELEKILKHLADEPGAALGLKDLQRFHLLYERTSADLAKVATFASEPRLVRYLESLVGRAYGEIHETRERKRSFSLIRFFRVDFPRAVRRHSGALALSVALTLLGSTFGGAAVAFDPEAKAILLPFSHLLGDPRERVKDEETKKRDRNEGAKGTFSSSLMTHNIRVSITCFGLGLTWGVGTAILLLYNGIILGAVALDYVRAGQTEFLLGWLLPHGSVEIPAFLLAGQAGLVLARALIGWGDRLSMRRRLRAVSGDLATLLGGIAALLVWAGILESYLSQHHEPVLPYALKIAFGTVQLGLLALYLARSGAARSGAAPRSGAEEVPTP